MFPVVHEFAVPEASDVRDQSIASYQGRSMQVLESIESSKAMANNCSSGILRLHIAWTIGLAQHKGALLPSGLLNGIC